MTITRKVIDPKIDFSFDSAHCASFIKMGAKLRGGGGRVGLHILTWDRADHSRYISTCTLQFFFCHVCDVIGYVYIICYFPGTMPLHNYFD